MPVEDVTPPHELKLKSNSAPPAGEVSGRDAKTALDPAAYDLWIEAGHTEKHYWLDLWRFRELLFILAWRDLAVRYKQTVAGVAWALLQPLASMLIMVLIFGKVAGFSGLPANSHAPYAIVVFAAMLPWNFFSAAMSRAGESIVGNANMISKIYFPRVIIPASSVIVSVVDFLISLGILAGLMAWYDFWPTSRVWALPVFTAMAGLASMGFGLFITALTVRYRDLRFVVPFIVQFGMWISPVAYPIEVVREKLGEAWFALYALNPLVGIIEGFRWAIVGGDTRLSWLNLLLSLVVSSAVFAGGVQFFRKTERRFADII